MTWLLAALLAAVVPQGPPADSRLIVRQALSAVAADSAAARERQWSRQLARDSTDRQALLGLGSLARLNYRYERSDSLLDRVVALEATDGLADVARLERAASETVRGRFVEASRWYGEALSGAERRRDTVLIAEALVGLAGPRSRLAPSAQALALLDRAARLIRGDLALEANERCVRSSILARTADPASEGLAIAGIALAGRAGDARQEGRCHQALAQSHASRRDLTAAFAALAQADPLFRSSGDHAALASMLQWQGFLHNSNQQYGPAREALLEAVAEGEHARAMSAVGWASINLGMIALGMGDLSGGRRELERAVTMLETQGDEWGVVTARGMLGGVARAAGDYPQARLAYDSALAWAVRSGHVTTRINMLSALSTVDQAEGDVASARRQLSAARDVARRAGMRNWEDALTYNDGRLALYTGDAAGAERLLRRALVVADTAEHNIRYATRVLLAAALVERGAIDEAEAELVAATDALDRWRASLTPALRVRASEFDHGADPDLSIATVISALAESGRVEAAWRLVERGRSRELSDRMQRARALQLDSGPPATDSAWPVSASPGAAAPAGLDDSTALIEFVTGRGGEPTTAFVIRGSRIAAQRLVPIDSIDAAVRRLLTLLEGDGDAREVSRVLGGALLEPLLPDLAGVARLVIVPDDVLSRLPFDALVLADGRYAIERFAISMAPSAVVLTAIHARPRNTAPVRLLALGDPRFDAAVAAPARTSGATVIYRSAFDAAGGLPRLAASAGEVRTVARFAPESELRLRERASESFLRSAPLDSYRVIHFATHALVDEESSARTALALSPGDGHDGFLGQADLAALRFNADLLVLSACRTAGGVVLRGEGIQGLTAPLLQAGARAIVASRWPVADDRVEPLMAGLYRALASGLPVSDALRAAKLEAMRAGAPVREWAAFTVIGDPLVTVPLEEGAADPTWLQLGVLAGLLAIGFGYYSARKRRGIDLT